MKKVFSVLFALLLAFLLGFAPGAAQAAAENVQLVGSWPFGPSYAVAHDSARSIVFCGSGAGVYVLDKSEPARPAKLSEIGSQGLVWGVMEDALPLEPGEILALTVGDAYYWPEYSKVSWPIPANRPIYVQVDSANTGSSYGAVLETHEMTGDEYNNIAGPVYLIQEPPEIDVQSSLGFLISGDRQPAVYGLPFRPSPLTSEE